METGNPFALNLRVKQYFMKDFLADIGLVCGDKIEIFFINEHSYISGHVGYIKPLALMIRNRDGILKKILYKKNIDELMNRNNPLFRDLYVSKFRKNLKPGVSILQIWKRPEDHTWKSYKQPKDKNAEIADILRSKYENIKEPHRGEIYRVREIGKKNRNARAMGIINKFIHKIALRK
jgi:hypothetical protein